MLFDDFLPKSIRTLIHNVEKLEKCTFFTKNQPFMQKMADFSKIFKNEDENFVLTETTSPYMTFIQKNRYFGKMSIFGISWLDFWYFG